jgi:hypothetical protein
MDDLIPGKDIAAVKTKRKDGSSSYGAATLVEGFKKGVGLRYAAAFREGLQPNMEWFSWL